MKVIYIAHPISGDVAENVRKVEAIIAQYIITEAGQVLPFAPYLTALRVLDDDNAEHRALGMAWNLTLLRRGFIDELHLHGDTISEGMWTEIREAWIELIDVVPMTEGTKAAYAARARR